MFGAFKVIILNLLTPTTEVRGRERNHGSKRGFFESIFVIVVAFNCLFSVIRLAEAQIPILGSMCPMKTSSIKLDLTKITGTWYEIEASPTFMEYNYKCVSIKVPAFYERKTEITVDAVNRITGNIKSIQTLEAHFPDSVNEKDGVMEITLLPNNLTLPENKTLYGPVLKDQYQNMTVQLLATDYTNWALIWMCKKHGANARTELVWVLARERIPSEDQYEAIREAKRTHNLESISTRDTIQWRCSKEETMDMDRR